MCFALVAAGESPLLQAGSLRSSVPAGGSPLSTHIIATVDTTFLTSGSAKKRAFPGKCR